MSDPTLANESIVTLREERKKREHGLEPKVRIKLEDSPSVLVVLEDDNGDYHCHRYTERMMTSSYDCSYDGQRVDIDAVFKWLNDPRALR